MLQNQVLITVRHTLLYHLVPWGPHHPATIPTPRLQGKGAIVATEITPKNSGMHNVLQQSVCRDITLVDVSFLVDFSLTFCRAVFFFTCHPMPYTSSLGHKSAQCSVSSLGSSKPNVNLVTTIIPLITEAIRQENLVASAGKPSRLQLHNKKCQVRAGIPSSQNASHRCLMLS